ncbi:MAG: DNA topoisomerase, partial [Phycisphaerales bacterium]
AQRLYEGISIPGEGETGLITYMRTDSTYVSGTALNQAREFILKTFGPDYLPEKPNFYSSSNKDAQEAHEAIRPTSVDYHPDKIKSSLTSDQYRLYKLIWDRFVSSQMTPAKYNSTAVTIEGGTDPKTPCTFRTSGRVLVFDGYTRVAGQATSEEQTLPDLKESDPLAPFSIEPLQTFSAPPSRFTEAGLIKELESKGIGRPSTYASIISVIQDRKYVELLGRSFYATDLGEVVTDKLIEAFPYLMELGYTREMEDALDEIETEHRDWRDTLELFYGRFKKHLDEADEKLSHAKAEIQPAPEQYRCQKCGASTVYRFGKNGRFLSCSTYPECNWACPIDREGRPLPAEYVNIRCPKTGRPMMRKTGRFGPFVTTYFPDEVDEETRKSGMILNIDKKGYITAPSPPPLVTDMPCPKCSAPLNLRDGARGPWLGCSKFPKCRGRGKWAELDEDAQAKLQGELDSLLKANPIPVIRTLDGRTLTDEKGKPLPDAPKVDELLIDDPARYAGSESAA